MKAGGEVGAHMKSVDIDALFDPEKSFGAATAMIEGVLADWQAKRV
jgi:hypothetical protein